MSDGTMQNSVRYSVKNEHDGGIIPGTRSEMWRDVYLRSGAIVHGGIFCGNLLVQGGDVVVDQAVYTRSSIRLTDESGEGTTGDTVFRSAVTTSDTILVDDSYRARTRILADVFAKRANLRNTVVLGNLYAESAVLKDCVVLGGVFCTGALTLENVVISTFRAKNVTLRPNLSLLYPFAFSEEPMALDFEARVLSFLDLFEDAGPDAAAGVVPFGQDDIVPVTEEHEDGGRTYHMLSLGPRILDLEKVKQTFQRNTSQLKLLALGSHVGPSERRGHHFKGTKDVENRLWSLLKDPPIPTFESTTSLDEISSRKNIQNFMEGMAEA